MRLRDSARQFVSARGRLLARIDQLPNGLPAVLRLDRGHYVWSVARLQARFLMEEAVCFYVYGF
jgi:hypothetical protein